MLHLPYILHVPKTLLKSTRILFYPCYWRTYDHNVAKVSVWWFPKIAFFILTKCEPRKAEEKRRRYRSEEKETTRVRWTELKVYVSLVASLPCTASQTGRQTDRQIHDDIVLDQTELDCVGWNFVRYGKEEKSEGESRLCDVMWCDPMLHHLMTVSCRPCHASVMARAMEAVCAVSLVLTALKISRIHPFRCTVRTLSKQQKVSEQLKEKCSTWMKYWVWNKW